MGALVGENKQAYWRQQGLPIAALSDPRIGSTFSSFSVLPMLSEKMSAPVCVGLRLSLFSVLSVSLWLENKSAYRNLESTVCGDRGIGVIDYLHFEAPGSPAEAGSPLRYDKLWG
jgi:hypothetical protein